MYGEARSYTEHNDRQDQANEQLNILYFIYLFTL